MSGTMNFSFVYSRLSFTCTIRINFIVSLLPIKNKLIILKINQNLMTVHYQFQIFFWRNRIMR